MGRPLALLVTFVMLAGCAWSAPARPPPQPAPGTSPGALAGDGARRAGAEVEREFTGQEQPSITLRNAFPTVQHVFIDWVHVGSLAPSSAATFAVSAGTHTLTSAESMDVDDRPVSVTETFESGFRYDFQIVPE